MGGAQMSQCSALIATHSELAIGAERGLEVSHCLVDPPLVEQLVAEVVGAQRLVHSIARLAEGGQRARQKAVVFFRATGAKREVRQPVVLQPLGSLVAERAMNGERRFVVLARLGELAARLRD